MRFERPIVGEIMAAMERKLLLLQVLVGPRQVGKTTAASQVEERLGWPSVVASADAALPMGVRLRQAVEGLRNATLHRTSFDRAAEASSAEGAAYTSLGQRPRWRPGTRQRAESPAQGFGSRAMDWPAAQWGDGTGFQPFVPVRIVTWAVGPGWYSARQWRCRSPRPVTPKKPQESAGKLITT
ncbi:MAG: hypothetical protein ACLQM8_05495 [Limisphaerales bacterium]